MAKGNIFLGYARGSVGDVTLSKINGQQVSRARNRNPKNPRTLAQCFQRGRFAAAVKFFTRGRQALYKFAFESKKQIESDYNAFMANNVKIAPAISKAAFDNYDYPVVAPFIMSKGSLQPLAVSLTAENGAVNLGGTAPAEAPTTIGQLSAALLFDAQYQAGDIMTFVFISSAYNGTYPSIEATGSGKTSWEIRQFIIDPESTATIANTIGMQYAAAEGAVTLTIPAGASPLGGTLHAMTAIHSRNTDSGLKTSTQELVLSAAADTAYEAMQADSYKQSVSVSWKQVGKVDVQPEAILQGSIAYGEQ